MMKRGVYGAYAGGNDPRACRSAPRQPIKVAVRRPRTVAQQRGQPRKQQASDWHKTYDAPFSERVHVQAMRMRLAKIAGFVVVLALLRAPGPESFMRNQNVVVLADAEPRIFLPGRERHPPDSVAVRKDILGGGI